MAKLTNHVQRTRLVTSSTDKHYSLDSEDDFRSGCRNVSQQQQFFSELPSPGRSHYTKYMQLFKNLKARILKSIITWSAVGKLTAQARGLLIGYQMRSMIQNKCAVFITKHQSLKVCQHFIDLSSCTIKKFA